MTSERTAFVTGATGFLGLNLVEQLCAAGYRVTALHRRTSDLRLLERLDAGRAVGDVTDRVSLEAAMPEGVDVVFHAAASTSVWSRNDEEQTRVNVEGTRNMLEVALAKAAKRFVHTSSSTVFGLGGGPFDEDSPLLGRGSWINYVRTKALADDLVREAASKGLSSVILRPAHIMGRYDRGNWATLVRLAARGELPGVPSGSGCFCNGREVARAHLRAAECRGEAAAFVLGGPRASFVELVAAIGEVTGRKVPSRPMPDLLMRAAARVFVAMSAVTGKAPRATPEGIALVTHDLLVDDAKAREVLDYAHVPLSDTVRESYEFLRDEGLI